MAASSFYPKYRAHEVTLKEKLGEGSFGVVQEGILKGQRVAVKVLTPQRNVILLIEAEKELKVIAQLSHTNIVKLLGVITDDFQNVPKLIFEFVDNGCMSSYVRKVPMTDAKLIGISYDIACGMDYLHEMKHIHRDLAGRNVLIDSKGRAKVADFGLSRVINIDDSNYYQITSSKPVPIRWYPKESIPMDADCPAKFSFASDVWSFGVTMFEAWTLGGVPYGHINNAIVCVRISEGKNPNDFSQPTYPNEITRLLNSIFKVDPNARPSFSHIKTKLSELIKKTSVKHTNGDDLETLFNKVKISDNSASVALVKDLKDAGRIKTLKVEKVMLIVDRAKYVKTNPYVEKPQSIGCRVNISAPHMHATMLELVAEKLSEGGTALDIGSGSGYVTVCMAIMAGPTGRVVGIEHMTDLHEQSILNVKADNPKLLEGRVKFVVGDGRKGYEKGGPYDVIHIGAATPSIPDSLMQQLKNGGRIVSPVGPPGGSQQLQTIDKINGKIVTRSLVGVIFASLTSQTEQLKG